MYISSYNCNGLRELQNNKALKHPFKRDYVDVSLRELQNNKALKPAHRTFVNLARLRELQNNKALKLKCEDKSSYRHTVVLFML